MGICIGDFANMRMKGLVGSGPGPFALVLADGRETPPM